MKVKRTGRTFFEGAERESKSFCFEVTFQNLTMLISYSNFKRQQNYC